MNSCEPQAFPPDLLGAIENDNAAEAAALLEENLPIADKFGFSLAHHAASKGAPACLRLILEHPRHGPGAQGFDRFDMSPLHWAATSGNAECVRLLLPHCDPNHKSQGLITPLHNAVRHENLEACEILIPLTANIGDLRNEMDRTLLILACDSGNAKLAALLIPCCPIDHQPEGQYVPALGHAVFNGDAPMVKLLLEAGADPLFEGKRTGSTALHIAAQQDAPPEAIYPLLPLCRTDKQNACGDNPLHICCTNGAPRALAALLQSPQRASALAQTNKQGLTPLQTALQMDMAECAAAIVLGCTAAEIEQALGSQPIPGPGTGAGHAVHSAYARAKLKEELCAELPAAGSAPKQRI